MSYAEKSEDITKEEWMDKLNNVHIQRADMNRLIMNYLVTEGFKEAAEKFRMESGIEPSVDLDSLDERIKIREMILKGQIQEAIALINSLHPELLDTNRYLYFHLQQQHLIELIRLRETEAALEFAQTQLAEQGEESRECLTEMERTLALLAFDNPEDSPFGDLLNMMQRQKVWSEVNQAVLDYENRESTPKLAKLLKLLLWAQNELDQKKVKYPKMTDLSKGTIEDPKPLARIWTVVLLLGTCLLYCARVAMPICAVTMADQFKWSKSESGMVLGSFFWGYCFTQVLGGYVSDRVGGEKVLLLSAAAWGAMTAFTPVLARLCSQPIVSMTLARFLMGLLQGVHYPSLASLCSQKVIESPIITLESLGSGGAQPKLSKRHWLRLFKQPAGWVFNVIPWFVAIPSSLFSGCLSDHLIGQGFDTASVRKLMQFFSMGVSSIFTLSLCGTTTFPTAVAFVSATMGLATFSHSGVSVNVQDLAPSCAGALFGVIMVYFSGYLIEATGSWASVFALISVVNLLGLGTFLLFAEARRVDIEGAKSKYHNIHI
ncbi:hypothetical protein JZ751_014630 [Albula glossodonta]|uniref:CTLH domain-containing protein n=2 Tax=Albula TaxID=54908 RepID=A0A8T2N4B5_9TELE|nr:hypothetical protein JZ751_014630 [Albula glossodonta]